MNEQEAVVYVVDDDQSVREALASLLRSTGRRVETFTSATAFLESNLPNIPSCLILDVRMPGVSGLDLQKRLTELNTTIPIVFISAHGDIPTSVRAIKAGAVEFLTKPFRDDDLLRAINEALEQDLRSRQQQAATAHLQERYLSLTPRERQVMSLVVSGMLNKQIANELGTSEITIKVHRRQVMTKMGANSLAELVRMSERLGVSPAEHS